MVQTLKTKGNAALKEKLKKQAGFTLVELLIVVAIIAILAAVAIPAYATQMEKSREAVDASNARAANSMASADYLLNGYKTAATYSFSLTAEGNIQISDVTGVTGGPTYPGGTAIAPQSNACEGTALTVVVEPNGVLGENSWVNKLSHTTTPPATT